ncbi:hypothetical protein ABK040_008048 [Willaertia magna]
MKSSRLLDRVKQQRQLKSTPTKTTETTIIEDEKNKPLSITPIEPKKEEIKEEVKIKEEPKSLKKQTISLPEGLVAPGTRIGTTDTYQPGKGTYTRDSKVYSSIVGKLNVINSDNKSNDTTTSLETSLPTIEVLPLVPTDTIVPHIGSIVTCKVIKTTKSFAKVDILCIDNKPVIKSGSTISGLLRVQDIRSTEIDKVVLYDCYRPGDIILAEIISLGDSRSYYISTAKNELGVVYANSINGAPMIPIDWTTMQCTKTSAKESRKVAKLI